MHVEVREEPASSLAEFARIPISFEVRSVFDVSGPGDTGAFVLAERRLADPWVKDYDADSGEGPTRWAHRFDVSNWGFLAARVGGRLVGAAVVAFGTLGVDLLEGRRDLAVLWDLRVAPEARGRGAGAALFRAAEDWARARGCTKLKIETQNINVPACRFYARHGCVLRAIDPAAYPTLPGEIQLLWYKDLGDEAVS
ncbi:MAG: GNAT family N-acetyltransferase [Longimicrobiaceae bacterium]